MSDVIAIIPARYASTRLPGKPLAEIGNEPMVWHVYLRAAQALGAANVFVATDSDEVARAVTSRGGNAVLVNEAVDCGTARCAKALEKLGLTPETVINVQGDEPFIAPDDILRLAGCFNDKDIDIATLARQFDPAEGERALLSPHRVKLTVDCNGHALYFSRSVIPYVRNQSVSCWHESARYLIHEGTYAFRGETLKRVARLPVSSLEAAEGLEQLRWLQAGCRIKVVMTDGPHICVDTQEDLERARNFYTNGYS